MTKLSKSTCEACRADAPKLTDSEIKTLLPQVDGWELINDAGIQKLKRTFKTDNYSQSIDFTNAVAVLAEENDHHPQLIVEYASVTVIWWSHKIKGLHQNDFIMAAKTSERF